MDSIRERFLQAEQDFIVAARSNSSLLADFSERWQALHSEWDSCLHEADHGTQQLVDGVATRIERLAGDLYVVRSHSMSLEEDLLHGLEDVFASLTLEDAVNSVGLVSTEVPPPARAGSRCTVSPAEWLLRNLHNPYPPLHTRFSVDPPVGSKHVKDWFSKARQRIGWTRLLRDRFAGCRSLTTDAAFRAFVRDDPSNPLDINLKTAFLAIKSHAELVYGAAATVSNFSYKRLRGVSPTPSLTFSSGSEETDDELCPVPSLGGNFSRPSKRMFSDPSNPPSPKRKRTHQSPSPPTIQAKDVDIKDAEIPFSRLGKRRLSESDSDCPRPKRPRGMNDGRLYTVSDPASAVAVIEWFNFDQSFQIPSPASTNPVESPAFDLDFFNPPPLPLDTVPSILAPLTDVVAPVEDFSALFEMPQLDLLQSDLPTFHCDWSEFLNFQPEFSLFPSSPSLTPSLASTPPLVDDATLSPSSTSYGGPSSPVSVPDILPHLSDKEAQLPTLRRAIIRGQDFLLPPGETAGIPSASTLLSVY